MLISISQTISIRIFLTVAFIIIIIGILYILHIYIIQCIVSYLKFQF